MLSDTMMLGGGRKAAYSIENSLLFRDGQYLSRTPNVPGNRYTWTFSAWVRRGSMATQMELFGCFNASGGVYISASGQLLIETYDSFTSTSKSALSQAVFCDPTAWYHVVAAVDTSAAAGARVRGWVNGVQVIGSGLGAYVEPTQNALQFVGYSGQQLAFGCYTAASNIFSGQMAELIYVDGAALTPASFGESDHITGNWRPKAISGITWGTNGCYLGKPWNDASLGTDYSGTGNHWTPSGFVASDVLKDSPTNVYATLNPLDKSGVTLSAGNMTATWASAGDTVRGTLGFSSGKWEWQATIANGSGAVIGIKPASAAIGGSAASYGYYGFNGTKIVNGSASAYGAAFGNGDKIKLRYDDGSLEFFKWVLGAWVSQGVVATGLNGTLWLPFVYLDNSGGSTAATIDFGQSGFAPATGFKALCTANLPTPVSAAAKRPHKYYSCQLVTHNGTSTAFTLGWNPDPANGGSHTLFRVKNLVAASWYWHDTVRGIDKFLNSDSTAGEITSSTHLMNLSTTGASLGEGQAAGTYLVEAWRVAPEAGFDIVTYTGTGGARRIAHHNGAVPALIVCRNRGVAVSSGNWFVKHSALPTGYYLYLNSSMAARPLNNSASGSLSDLDSSATFGVSVGGVDAKDANNLNELGQNYVAYVWAEVPGFSKFGSHVGNGAQDGPFDWQGFVPGAVTMKATGDVGGSWISWTAARNTSNPAGNKMALNLSVAENDSATIGVSSTNQVDFLAGAVKCRGNNADQNTTGVTYITAAWAAHPLGAKRVTPATAR
jgi:hypothetical protein